MNALVDIWRNLSGCDPSEDAQLYRLAAMLQLPVRQVAQIPDDPRLSYRNFTIKKRNRKPRRIDEPSSVLKQLQRRFLHQYLATMPVSSAATAFRPGMSIATHARSHLRQSIVLTVDLTDFFHSTSSRRINAWFRQQGWHGQALGVVMRLTVYRGSLPQGAPTSPALSNLVNRPLDRDLMSMATLTRGHYSRYCDDLAFSWSTDREPPAWRLKVEERLLCEGYTINQEKGWTAQLASENPELTGVAIEGSRLGPSKATSRKIRRLRWKRKSQRDWQQWQGYRGFLKMLGLRV